MKRYRVGLALSGGGARGFAHCGALLALEEFGLKPDIICGTSAGAMAGAMYCAGVDPFSIAESFIGKEFSEFAKFSIPHVGLFNHEPLLNFIKESLNGKSFEDLEIPIHIVTGDIDHGQTVVFTDGDLAKIVQASVSIPVIFNPIEIDGVHYVDGGLFCNLPASPIRDICDIVVGINVNPKVVDKYRYNLINIALRSFYFMTLSNTVVDIPLCDILVELEELQQYTMFDLKNINTIFRLGYISTVRQLEQEYKIERIHPSRLRDLTTPTSTHIFTLGTNS